jgi:excisionase family DNA binding protein
VEKQLEQLAQRMDRIESLLSQVLQRDSTEYLSIRQAVQRTGLSQSFIRRAIKSGKLPASKKGDTYRIARADLDSWMDGGKVSPARSLPTVKRRGLKDHYADL